MCKFNSQALFKDFNKGHHHYNPVLFTTGNKPRTKKKIKKAQYYVKLIVG